LADEDCGRDLKKIANNNESDIVEHRIDCQFRNDIGDKEKPEILETNKGAAEQSQAVMIVDECVIGADERNVEKHEEINKSGQEHQEENFVLTNLEEKTLLRYF
jgi:hypothetical protein